ncbi:MAG: S1 RNA-binding domain-containing protein [Myxococcota bacterium]|nr:S1 RNA-binding domain-containing protein [Myxococcota bacterium]
MRQLKAEASRSDDSVSSQAVDRQIHAQVRTQILAGHRLDGRGASDIRPLACQVNPLPGCHGSAIFERGGTQVLASLILGGAREAQDIETLNGNQRRRFILHYAFPGYSVGANRRGAAGPGRREIGHGHLARRAIEGALPTAKDFPFTTRITADVLESDGSSSMATVCASSLALAMAGLPMKGLCAGIAMGVIIEGDTHHLLTDISGEEDFFGDMDFKIAGTRMGVTAIQLDTKRTAIPLNILSEALEQGSVSRTHILSTMNRSLEQWRSRDNTSSESFALFKVDTGRVGHVIGSGGKHLQKIQSTTQARVEVTREGHVLITGRDKAAVDAARRHVLGKSTTLKDGEIYEAKVKSKKEYGIFVSVGEQDALVHTSELSRLEVADYTIGADIRVKVLGTDDRGRIKLSERAATPGSD